MEQGTLGAFEYEVLSALIHRPRDAYGTTIRRDIAERTGREPSVGALYTTLDRLETKGLISSWWGEATAERGGRRKRYFRIEAPGEDAVRRTQVRQSRWQDLPGYASAGA